MRYAHSEQHWWSKQYQYCRYDRMVQVWVRFASALGGRFYSTITRINEIISSGSRLIRSLDFYFADLRPTYAVVQQDRDLSLY
jgi:hypothetical protein